MQYRYAPIEQGNSYFGVDDCFLYLNVEDDFIEVSYGCVVDPLSCAIQSSHRILLERKVEHDSKLWSEKGIWQLRPGKLQITFSIVKLVHDIACLVASFAEDISFINEIRDLRVVTIIGGGSPDSLDAAKAALPFALPDVDPAIFLSSLEPQYVPSVGAALMSRVVSYREWYRRYG